MTAPCMSCAIGSHRMCVAVITGRCGCICRPAPKCDPTRSIVWTGDNEAEVEAFAATAAFGFVVGTPLDDADDHPGHVDSTALEVYPHDLDGHIWHWTAARPGDRVYADGRVESREDAT